MKLLLLVAAVLAIAQAQVLVGPSTRVLQGPSSRTTVVGPDGSAISAVAPGGQIVSQEGAGVVAQTAHVVAAAPAVVRAAPLWAGSGLIASPWAGGLVL